MQLWLVGDSQPTEAYDASIKFIYYEMALLRIRTTKALPTTGFLTIELRVACHSSTQKVPWS